MTCYFRHLNNVFEKAGITVTAQNKAELDGVIHKMVGEEYKNCPATWKQVKRRINEDEAHFVSELKQAWVSRQKP